MPPTTINKNVPPHIRGNRARNMIADVVKDDKAAREALRREGFKDIDAEMTQLRRAYFDATDSGHADAVETMQGLYAIVHSEDQRTP